MIFDKLENYEAYKNLSPDIYAGLKFLVEAKPDIELGTYSINERVKAIVSSYPTVDCFERGFEAHKHVIDIQFPIIGLERVKWSPIDNMVINIPYDIETDSTYYNKPAPNMTEIIIGGGFFGIMFPWDGHSPQHLVGKSEVIKKITIKVSI